jgi:C4-dicarboxylate-specific signal transduction histidine kinase
MAAAVLVCGASRAADPTTSPAPASETSAPSLWTEHRELVVAVTAVGIVQTLLIARLLGEHQRRRQAERAGRQQLVAMAHLDRRAAMGEMAAALAHELNQPLGAILHNAESAQMLLEGEDYDHEEMNAIIADILKADQRASEVIRRMRALLQKHELERNPVDVNGFVEETVALALPVVASRGAHVDLVLGEGLTSVAGDRIHLQQVLLNLLLNALDAVTAMAPERRRLVVRTRQEERHIEVLVQDGGCGIAPDAVTRIFEPFYTTKAQGMGMGLSIARSIVEAHGGSISAENNPGGGATLRLRIPGQAAS